MRISMSRLLWRVVPVLVVVASTRSLAKESQAKAAEVIGPPRIDKPLIACWHFDEEFGQDCADAAGNGCDVAPEPGRTGGLDRTQGVYGGAMSFTGRHMLRVPRKPDFDRLGKISLSAWTMPTELSGYRQIFRKDDGSDRVLFSFQHDGTILSLGLNIGGYVECDAKIDPKRLLDGAWHHCAATFDGAVMRVYLDGKQVGALERRGTITAGGGAPGCIGSSDGREYFLGAMDELRIYRDALTPEEIARLHQSGVRTLAKAYEPAPAGEAKIDKPLLAHWTFNEIGPVIHDTSVKSGLDVVTKAMLCRTRGVYGRALDLHGSHALKTRGVSKSASLAGITLSAWAKPTDVSGYREIFRQEADQRLLFSFQESGSILSLGLNIGGYIECDGKISSAQLLDGWWHHCAATFDGKCMRIYFDGKEVGALERSGTIATTYAAPSFIGSSGGQNEHFQGALDDLRVYGQALSPADVALLYKHGQASLDKFAEALAKDLGSFYVPGKTFAETLANSRRNLFEKNLHLTRDLAEVLVGKLRADFPEDCDKFVEFTGIPPIRFLMAKDDAAGASHASRLIELMLEYKPLTDDQWKRQTPEQVAQWKQADAIAARFEALKARGDAARFSPEWVDVILAAGRRIQFRPHAREPVAPYRTPSTPETRTLSAEEARAALERDWLHQADNKPTPQRIRDEIEWTLQLAGRIQADYPGKVDVYTELARLAELADLAARLTTPDPQLYFQVRRLKRQIVFKNPVLDFTKILLVDMPFPQGSEWPHETRHRLGYMAVPGARLLVLDGLSPDGKLTQLMPKLPLHGSFWRPDLSYDAKKVVFCFKPHNEKSFHLYEINIDGTGLRQITDGPFDDIDPIYLPDGENVAFVTTRGLNYVRCMPPTNSFVLTRCRLDGKKMYFISRNNEPDYLPSLMPD
ncbi:MAG: PD40 domain-containing protein, partial [Phycisphaerae bacterium]|nr:PD40 domain-containing protein [Phycisphaerae bacterium]